MDAIILAGGLGTRLYPLTLSTPKSLLPFLDRAIIEYQLDIVAEAGCESAAAAAGHMAGRLGEYAGYSTLPFSCIKEEKPLGTGGALANAVRVKNLRGPLLVVNGDVICDLAPRSLFATAQKLGTLATIVSAPVGDPTEFGTLEVDKDGKLSAFREKEKPAEKCGRVHVNAGIYYLQEEAVSRLAEIDGAFSMENDFFPALASEGEVAVHSHNGFWRDIGTLERYFKAHFDVLGYFLMMGTANFGGARGDYSLFRDFIYIHHEAALGAGCDLYHRVVLMREADVGEKTLLRNCVVLPGAKIGKGCKLETVLVDAGMAVPDGAEIDSKVITEGHEEHFTG